MGKLANRLGVVAVGLAVAVAGCASHVTEDEMADAIAGVRADVDANSDRISANEDAIEGLRGDMDQLREDLAGMRSDYDARIQELEDRFVVALPVHFEFDKADVRPVDEPILDRFADMVSQNVTGDGVVTIEGFADPAGSEAYNRQLAKKRADNVKQYLMSQGVSGDLLKAVSYGESRLVNNQQGPGRSGLENRRVTFVIDFAGNLNE